MLLGLDVGGTHTDAVVVHGILFSVKNNAIIRHVCCDGNRKHVFSRKG